MRVVSFHYAEYSSRSRWKRRGEFLVRMVDLPLDARILDLGGGIGRHIPAQYWLLLLVDAADLYRFRGEVDTLSGEEWKWATATPATPASDCRCAAGRRCSVEASLGLCCHRTAASCSAAAPVRNSCRAKAAELSRFRA